MTLRVNLQQLRASNPSRSLLALSRPSRSLLALSRSLLAGIESLLDGGEGEDHGGQDEDLSASYTGDWDGRGGQMEVEVWREAGRLQALRVIESAELEVR